jgi:hypothetical protein
MRLYSRRERNHNRIIERSPPRSLQSPKKKPEAPLYQYPSEELDLAMIYFLHGASSISHMLAMGWAGESTAYMELDPWLLKKMTNPDSEIQVFGANHDLRRETVL